MSEISEKQAMEMFIHGGKKFMDTAKQLSRLQKDKGWDKVAKNMEVLLASGRKLFSMKAQTRTETLIMAGHVQADSTATQH